MKKLGTLAIIAIVAALVIVGAGQAGYEDSTTVWQIGHKDGAVNPIQGASEFPATGAYWEEFDYYVGIDADPINAPSMPGYIGNVNVSFFDPNRPPTDTTARLNIHFTLDYTGELTLIYGRYGSETDKLYLNGGFFATFVATEGGFQLFTVPLGTIQAGSHTITIEYADMGHANGHYIDYLRLKSEIRYVDIDIKPGSYPNSIKLKNKGSVPVAILSSETFDATTVDRSTVEFAGAAPLPIGKTLEDVNGDGLVDVVLHFKTQTLSLQYGDTQAYLTGQTTSGQLFYGYDSVRIIK